jgi:hypothetical protein
MRATLEQTHRLAGHLREAIEDLAERFSPAVQPGEDKRAARAHRLLASAEAECFRLELVLREIYRTTPDPT